MQNNLNRPLISFCIPTYNRAACAEKCVRWILEYPGDDIEVIVSDNGSPDDTMERISQIIDHRVKYFRNKKNEGVQYNIDRVLQEAEGRFCFLISDEDEVNVDIIPLIMDAIKKYPNLSLIYGETSPKDCSGKEYTYPETKLVKKGNDAIEEIAFKHGYLSGIIANKEMYQEIKNTNELWYQQDIFYPHEYLILRLAMMGDVYLMRDTILWTHAYDHVSLSASKEINSAYSYEGRLTTFKQRTRIIVDNIQDVELRRKLLLETLRNMLYCGTIGLYIISKDLGLSNNLQLEYRKYRISKTINSFYNDQIDFLKSGGLFTDKDLIRQARKTYYQLRIKSLFVNLYMTPAYYRIKKLLPL